MGLQPAGARGALLGSHRGCPCLGGCPASVASRATFAIGLLSPWIQGLTAAAGGGQRAMGEHVEYEVMESERGQESEASHTR